MAFRWRVRGNGVKAAGTGAGGLLAASIAANPIVWAIAGVVVIGGITLIIVKVRIDQTKARQPMTIVSVNNGEVVCETVEGVRNGHVVLRTEDGNFQVLESGSVEATLQSLGTILAIVKNAVDRQLPVRSHLAESGYSLRPLSRGANS